MGPWSQDYMGKEQQSLGVPGSWSFQISKQSIMKVARLSALLTCWKDHDNEEFPRPSGR
jgi:hypothetical protein